MSLFRNRLYLAVILGHFTIDVFNNSGPVMITFLSVPMGLSPAHIGLAVGLYQLCGSIIQPLLGWWADKIGSRWLGPGSVAWTVFFLMLAILIAQQTNNFYLFLIPFVLASLGSGTFHPLGTKHATDEAGPQTTTGTAIFFGFGQSGLAVGPILVGLILSSVGLIGIYGLAVLAIPLIIFMAYNMRDLQGQATAFDVSADPQPGPAKTETRWGSLVLLAILVGLRSWAYLGTVTFLPKMFHDMDWSATFYGLITGTFWIGSAVAGAVAGGLADRWGRRQIVFLSLLLGSLPLYFLPLFSGWTAFPLALVSGGLLWAPHSILVVIAQDLLPGQKGFTSGIALGYLFGIGAFASWGVGSLAAVWGLTTVIQAGVIVGLLAASLALFLPSTRISARPQAEGAPI